MGQDQKKNLYVVPHYYNDFHCIGSECEHTCCTSTWSIEIDKNSYEKYRNTKNSELKKVLDKGIKRIKDERKSEVFYAQIVGREDGLCGLLDERGLCIIQKEMGEKALCRTCRIFPRRQRVLRFDDTYETGYTMACPEVVRLALFNLNGISFEKTEIPSDNVISNLPSVRIRNGKEELKPIFFDIRDICIKFLKYRKTGIANRLTAMIMYLGKLQTVENIPDVLAISESYLEMLLSGEFDGFLDSLESNHALATDMEEAIYRDIIIRKNEEPFPDNLNSLYDNFIGFINVLDSENTVTGDTKKYAIHEYLGEKSKIWNEVFLKDYEYVLENYFVTLVFNLLIPITENDLSFFENAFTFAEQYMKFKLLVSTNAEDYGGITEKLVTDVAVLLSRCYEHGEERKRILEYYKEKDLVSMAHCTFLLR